MVSNEFGMCHVCANGLNSLDTCTDLFCDVKM